MRVTQLNSFSRLLLGGAALSAMTVSLPLVAFAQAAQEVPEAEAGEEARRELGKVVVTGTLIAGAAPVGSQPVVVDREAASKTGLVNLADIVRLMPQVQTGVSNDVGFQGGSANQGYNGSQTETINLRGLGSATTLILVDGRRVVGQGAASTLTDANQVPLAALERIEILPDGASALYGSDAVAGVVNYVLRRDFEGVEASLSVGNQSGGTEYNGSLTAGKTWDSLGSLGRGNVIFTFEHQDREAFSSGKIDRLRYNLSPLGGPDLRVDGNNANVGFSPNIISQGATANPTIPTADAFTYWGVPAGNGTGLTPADLALNQPNLVEGADYRDWTGEQKRDLFGVYFNQELTPDIELFGNLTYRDRETITRHPRTSVNIGLAGTPFFIAGLPANQQVQYSTLKDGQQRVFTATSETIGGVLGLRAQLPGDWSSEFYYNYGRNAQCDSCVEGVVNTAALTAQVIAGNINPLSSNPLTAQQMDLVYGSSLFESRTRLEDFVAKFDGPLFELPAGTVKVAVGGEYREEANANQNVSTTGLTNTPTVISTQDNSRYERSVESLFAEFNIPVLDESMSIPLVQSLTLSAAARYDNYSDVGSTTNPRIGFTWDVVDAFSISGNWGTSFRAPSITDINPASVTSGSLLPLPNWDPRITNGFLPAGIIAPFGLTNAGLFLGANPNLEPETSENWSLSGNFQKDALSLGVTAWGISFDDQIAFPGTLAYISATPADVPANGGSYGGWAPYIIPVNNPVTCNNADPSTADPALQEFLQAVNYDFVASGGAFSSGSSLASNFCAVNVILDSRIQNVSSVEQAGLDINASYVREFNGVDLTGRINVSRLLKNDQKVNPEAPEVEMIGDLLQPASSFKWRGQASVTAIWNDFDGTLAARYLHSISATGLLDGNGLPLPERKISAHTEFDLTLGYTKQFDKPGLAGMDGWRAQLAVRNLFDELPDFFVTPDEFGWHRKYGVPFGRAYTFQLSATF